MRQPVPLSTRHACYRPVVAAVALGITASMALAQTTRPTVDANNTLSADRPILPCPVEQKTAKHGAAPDPEVIKKVLRCRLGEKAASKGYDGALTIEISALQIGAPRPWDRLRDMNGGVPGTTVVYPVKATYTEKTFYRAATEVGANWIRIFNFFVNGFGEWQYGSAETIKTPDNERIPAQK